jgi:hypothetical protein
MDKDYIEEIDKMTPEQQFELGVEFLEIKKKIYSRTVSIMKRRTSNPPKNNSTVYSKDVIKTVEDTVGQFSEILKLVKKSHTPYEMIKAQAGVIEFNFTVGLEIAGATEDEKKGILQISNEVINRINNPRKPRNKNLAPVGLTLALLDEVPTYIFSKNQNRGYLTEEDYLEENKDKAHIVKTNKNKDKVLNIHREGYEGDTQSLNALDAELDPYKNIELYARLTQRDLFWYQIAGTLLHNGHTQINVNEMLKMAGIENANSATSRNTRKKVYTSIRRLMTTYCRIDAEEEAKHIKNRNVTPKREGNLLYCTIHKKDENSCDFWIEPFTPIGKDNPIEAAPVIAYALEKKRISGILTEDYLFESNIRNIDIRILWGMILRQARAEYTNKKDKTHTRLFFEQMFDDLGFNDDTKYEIQQIQESSRKEIQLLEQTRTADNSSEIDTAITKIKDTEESSIKKKIKSRNKTKTDYINKLQELLEERQSQGKIRYAIDNKREYLEIEELQTPKCLLELNKEES